MDCIIIGKGPSLEFVTKENLGTADILCLNSSIIQIEKLKPKNKLYSMQRDYCITKPKKANLLLHKQHSKDCFPGMDRIIFDEAELGLAPETASALCAVRWAKQRYENVKLMCFDACTHGDTRTFGKGELEKPTVIGNDYLGMCDRLRKEKVEFI